MSELSDYAAIVDRQRAWATQEAHRLRAHRVQPIVTYRCVQGDLLLALYATRSGIVWYTPKSRISRQEAERTPSRHLLWADVDESPAALRTAARAGLLSDDGSIPIACRHNAGAIPIGELLGQIERAHAGRRAVKVIVDAVP